MDRIKTTQDKEQRPSANINTLVFWYVKIFVLLKSQKFPRINCIFKQKKKHPDFQYFIKIFGFQLFFFFFFHFLNFILVLCCWRVSFDASILHYVLTRKQRFGGLGCTSVQNVMLNMQDSSGSSTTLKKNIEILILKALNKQNAGT